MSLAMNPTFKSQIDDLLIVEWWRLSRIQPTTNFGDTSNGFQDERGEAQLSLT